MEPNIVQKNFGKKPLVVFIIVLSLIGIGLFVFNATPNSPFKKQSYSPYILDLTAPINTIFGTVTQISGNIITVKADIPLPPDNGNPTPIKKLTFKVKTSAAELKIGQKVTVFSKQDLRTISGIEFEAERIMVASEINASIFPIDPAAATSSGTIP